MNLSSRFLLPTVLPHTVSQDLSSGSTLYSSSPSRLFHSALCTSTEDQSLPYPFPLFLDRYLPLTATEFDSMDSTVALACQVEATNLFYCWLVCLLSSEISRLHLYKTCTYLHTLLPSHKSVLLTFWSFLPMQWTPLLLVDSSSPCQLLPIIPRDFVVQKYNLSKTWFSQSWPLISNDFLLCSPQWPISHVHLELGRNWTTLELMNLSTSFCPWLPIFANTFARWLYGDNDFTSQRPQIHWHNTFYSFFFSFDMPFDKT